MSAQLAWLRCTDIRIPGFSQWIHQTASKCEFSSVCWTGKLPRVNSCFSPSVCRDRLPPGTSPAVIRNGVLCCAQVNLALKQKSDIEHYRNKLRLKAKRKGYYDFPSGGGSNNSRALVQTQQHSHERTAFETGRPLEPDDEQGSTYVKSYRRLVESKACQVQHIG